MKRLLSAFLLNILVVAAFAQHPMLRNFGAKEYGGGTQNWGIDKTASNRILVANNMGLLIYDSRQWYSCPLPNYTNVRSILYDGKRECVWSGGTNEFGYFHQIDNTPVVYKSVSSRLKEEQRQFGEVWNILRIGDDIVFQAKDVLFFLHADNKLDILHLPFSIECSAMVGNKIVVADNSMLYVVEKGKCKMLPGTAMLQGKSIKEILPYRKGSVIVCTTNDGLFLYDGKKVTPFVPELMPFLRRNQLYCASIQGDVIAVGTVRRGIVMYDLKTGKSLYANTETGLADNTVLSLCFDEIGNIWLGLDCGVAYVMPSSPVTRILGSNCHIGTGYASVVFGDNLYIGTNQGLFTVPYPFVNTPTPLTPSDVDGLTGQIWALNVINNTLLCASNEGAYVVEGQKVRRIRGPEGTWCFIKLHHHPGYILGCDYNGLFLLREEDMSFAWRIKGFKENSGTILEDTDGSIWMSHWRKGIYRLTLSDDAKRVEKVERFGKGNGLLLDNDNLIAKIDGKLVISCVDGFYRYNRESRQLEHDGKMNDVFNTYGIPLRLIETPAHDVWAYKANYLAIAHKTRNGGYEVDSLSYKGIMHELQMGLGHPGFLTDRNQTVFNSQNGLVLADNKAFCKPHEANLFVEKITSIANGDSVLYSFHSPQADGIYRISHSDNSLRLHFIMPEYMNTEDIEYSCLLDGYDKEWSRWQHANTKDYTRLPKGDYVFRVKARNKITGYEDEVNINIRIAPALYETWWAHLIYTLILILVLLEIIRVVKRMQERKIRQIELRKEREMRRQQAEYELENQKLRNEQLETELKHRQSEIGDSTMNLMRKNDMLQSLDAKLSELSESVRREAMKAKITQRIKEIRHEVQTNINDDEGWDKFEENFNLVYDNFMKHLSARFPDLKKSDRKLCAYLRMGLSSKEMASLLNTSVRSIETARYRLRKKLGIEQGDNLTEFIQSFE